MEAKDVVQEDLHLEKLFIQYPAIKSQSYSGLVNTVGRKGGKAACKLGLHPSKRSWNTSWLAVMLPVKGGIGQSPGIRDPETEGADKNEQA